MGAVFSPETDAILPERAGRRGMVTDTCAFVGAVGGAGTSQLTLECAGLLAREGRDGAVLDATFGTQGLADRTPGGINPDVTALCLEAAPLADGLVDLDVGGPGAATGLSGARRSSESPARRRSKPPRRSPTGWRRRPARSTTSSSIRPRSRPNRLSLR